MAATANKKNGRSLSASSKGALWPWLGIAVVVILLDQFTKTLILGYYTLGQSTEVVSFFNIVRVHNTGAAFSFLAKASGWQRWFFIGLGVAAAIFITYLLKRHGGQKLFAWALALILGGAIGNVIDRALHGYVVDFLDFHLRGWHFPAFNVADAGISVGAALLILDELLRVRRSR
ncbi:signal peptidase II [Caldimonas brevitalea]|uniref:Lipoprotein signal peptidase n=1 Tax=Caldimonas brevitalea TaxID=413882 RepID=A0A0G3BT00_9BURK|nr:signal peptidase II [Caldimonas brevitalea]AKJ30501.1 peptidase A8 [Caldimonas brevitalea]